MRWLFALCGLLGSLAHADWVITPRGEARAGEPIIVDLLVANSGANAIADGLPARLPARVLAGQRSVDVALEAVDPPATLGTPIAPGAFRKQAYRTVLPPELAGTLTILLVRDQTVRALVLAEPQRSDPTDRNLVAAEAALTPHEPMYFIVGSRGTASAKLQGHRGRG